MDGQESMSNSKPTKCSRVLNIVKILEKGKPEQTVFSQSIMDFSPEELTTIINLLAAYVNTTYENRAFLLEQYNQLPYKFTKP